MRAAIRIAALAVLAWPATAAAQNAAAADAAFREGRALLQQGRYAEACRKLEQSFELDPATGTLLNLGACQEALGRTASAWATFSTAAERARSQRRPRREAEARRRARELEPRLIRIRIEADTSPEGLEIRLGTANVDELIGVAIPVDPGSHSITASRAGHRPWSSTVAADTPGETIVVTLPELERLPEPPTPPLALEPTVPAVRSVPDDSRRRSRRRTALGLASAGGLALIGAGVTGGLARLAWNDAQSTGCVDERCTDRVAFERATRARDLGIASEVLVGIGAAGLIAGAVVWLTAPEPDATTVGVGTTADGTGLGVLATGTF